MENTNENKNIPSEVTDTFDARAMFEEEVSNELFGIEPEIKEEVVADSDSEKTSEEPTSESPEEAPETESETEVEKDSDEDILDELLDEEEAKGEAEDSEEETQDISEDGSTTYKLKVDGEEVEVTLDELKRGYGQQKSLTKKEMETAERSKQLDELQNTLTHLQYQGEFAPKFYEHDIKVRNLNEAKRALAENRPYKKVSGDALAKQIMSAEIIIEDAGKKLQSEYNHKMSSVEAPGRKELEAKLPDLPTTHNERWQNDWVPVGREFGFTDAELNSNHDFRWYGMVQELIDTRSKLNNLETRIKNAKAKRKGGKNVASKSSPRKATPTSAKKETSKTEVDYNNLADRINDGDQSARHELIEDLFK